jgi:hypothetical protein
MSGHEDIGEVMHGWPYKPGTISVRRISSDDGREHLQLRVDLGVLQMEPEGRPDGTRPEGFDTYLDYIRDQYADHPNARFSEHECQEMDREFLQYYHRRISWLALREFGNALRDADHTLALMDMVAAHSPDPAWTESHEQHRSYVLFHRTQAAALAELQDSGPAAAIEAINRGITQIQAAVERGESLGLVEQQPDEVAQLEQLKEWFREEFHLGRTLREQLSDAVANEDYERAARLRDTIARRSMP